MTGQDDRLQHSGLRQARTTGYSIVVLRQARTTGYSIVVLRQARTTGYSIAD